MIPPDKVGKMINPALATNCDQLSPWKALSVSGRIFSFNSTPNAVATNQFFISDSHLNSIAPVAIIPIAIIHAHKSNRELCSFSNVNYWLPLYLCSHSLSAINWITKRMTSHGGCPQKADHVSIELFHSLWLHCLQFSSPQNNNFIGLQSPHFVIRIRVGMYSINA